MKMTPAQCPEKAELIQALHAISWAIGCAQAQVIREIPSIVLPKEVREYKWNVYLQRMEKLTSARNMILSLIREEEKANA
jgi:hypothetical protein